MNASGTAPSAKKGSIGNPPPGRRISPQSQIVPEMSPVSIVSTLPPDEPCRAVATPPGAIKDEEAFPEVVGDEAPFEVALLVVELLCETVRRRKS